MPRKRLKDSSKADAKTIQPWNDCNLANGMTLSSVHAGLVKLANYVETHIARKMGSLGAAARDDPRLLEVVTSSDGVVDEEVFTMVNHLASKHRKMLHMLLFASDISTTRSGDERELSLSVNSRIGIAAINIACVFLEHDVARAALKKETIRQHNDPPDDVNGQIETIVQPPQQPVQVLQQMIMIQNLNPQPPLQINEPELAVAQQQHQELDNADGTQVEPPVHGLGVDEELQPEQEDEVANEQVHQTPTIARFQADFSQQEQQQVFHHLLRQSEGKMNITIPAKNGRHTQWYHFRAALGAITWKNFTRNAPVATITHFLSTIGGTLSTGIRHLIRRLHALDADAVVQGVRESGGTVLSPFSPVQTVAAQHYVGLTWRKMQRLSHVLTEHNGGNSVLSSYKQCAKVRAPQTIEYTHGTFEYTELISNTSLHRIVTVPYRVTCPYEAVRITLLQLRDGPQKVASQGAAQYSIGRYLGEEIGLAVGVNLQADHGNTDLRAKVTILVKPGATADASVHIGSYTGKDTHANLYNTLCPVINAGLDKLCTNNAVVLYWTTPNPGFDIVFVPADCVPVNAPNLTGALPDSANITRDADTSQITVTWVGAHPGAAVFERTDIPAAFTVRVLAFELFHVNDLKQDATVLGRPTYSATRCSVCDLHHSDVSGGRDWQGEKRIGEELTNEKLQSAIDALIAVNANPHATAAARRAAEELSAHYGTSTLPLLFPRIPPSRHLIPPLHTDMGIVLVLFEALFSFSDQHLEIQPPEQVAAQQRVVVGSC